MSVRQEINLHQPVIEQRDWLAFRMIPVWILGAAALLGAGSAVHWWHVERLEARAAALGDEVAGEEAQLETLKAQLPPQEPDPDLVARVEALESELAARERLGDQVVGRDGEWQRGFSGVFRALSRAPVDAVWLSGIRVRAGRDLRLDGFALEPEQVPAYMRRLGREPEFIGQSFRGIEMDRGGEDGDSNNVRFTLQGRSRDDD